jgi:hypothetical protein
VLSGWLLALSSTGLAITAHGLAGGGMPDTALVIPITALIALGGTAMAARLRGSLVLVPTVGLIQLGLHLVLSQHAYIHGAHRMAPPPVNGTAMLAGHALATVAVAILLARASTGLARFASAVSWLRSRLGGPWLVPVPVPAAIGATAVVPARPGPLLEIVLRRVRARRGPPGNS